MRFVARMLGQRLDISRHGTHAALEGFGFLLRLGFECGGVEAHEPGEGEKALACLCDQVLRTAQHADHDLKVAPLAVRAIRRLVEDQRRNAVVFDADPLDHIGDAVHESLKDAEEDFLARGIAAIALHHAGCEGLDGPRR